MRAKCSIPIEHARDRDQPPRDVGKTVPVKFAEVPIGTGTVDRYTWNDSAECWVAHLTMEIRE